jgi:hypothetical protein
MTNMVKEISKEHQYKRKPRKCPECKSNRIASILWGMPAYSKKLEKEMELGKVVLGGCCVTDNDPSWQCSDCNTEFYKHFDKEPLLKVKD